MNQYIRQHLLDYSILIVGLTSSICMFLIVWPDRYWLRVVAVALGIFYIVWGVHAHRQAGHISKKILAEYVTVALVGVSLLWMLSW